jgi:hypothetical protein
MQNGERFGGWVMEKRIWEKREGRKPAQTHIQKKQWICDE